ncbi:histidine phosphatase family protein [Patescibacteria group bacterium]
MFNTLYVVRHGETDWNQALKLQGWTDEPLNDVGFSQAQKISNFFVAKDIASIYTSDLSRTKQTAEVISEKLEMKITVSNLLRGRNFGEFSGWTWDDIQDKHPRIYEQIMIEQDELWSEHGIESIQSIKGRIQTFFNGIKDETGSIILVAHGATKRHILRFFNLIDSTERPKTSK